MRPRVVCAVVIAHVPENSAGNTWAFLNWALGLREAGLDVWLVEHLASTALAWPAGPRAAGGSLNERLWRQVVDEFGFTDRATLFIDGDAPEAGAFTTFAREADLFVNLSGQFHLHDRVVHIRRRLYVDLDPAFTQLWATTCDVDMNFDAHTDFASVGSCLDDAILPRTGHRWLPTLPPVSLAHWSPEAAAADPTPLPVSAQPDGMWTTVTHWYGYNQIPWDGHLYGNKRDSLVAIRELPRRGPRLLVVADLAPGWEDWDAFVAAGWRFAPPEAVCADWRVYRKFLAASLGEFSVAKDGYVVARCGWFSDRSACYLALGRPVALQDTGWPRVLPAGDGLAAWSTIDEAVASLEVFAAAPARHAAAARRIAQEHLAAPLVARRLLDQLGF